MKQALVMVLSMSLAVVAPTAGWAAGKHPVVAEPDPFMGDWQGTLQGANGKATSVVAQVLALGNGDYRINMLPEFDSRAKPLAVLNGKLVGGIIKVGNNAAIAGETFQGTLDAAGGGSFTMRKTVRLSPTLGAKPPEGAVVLFGAGNFDEWERVERPYGIVDLKAAVGGDQRVAYLRAQLTSPAAQEAQVELGSDDGVKVWLNGEVVHANNCLRGCIPGADLFRVTLTKGLNILLLKVNQGGGDWAACVRIVKPDGSYIEGLKSAPTPAVPNGEALAPLGPAGQGYILGWEVSGPYLLRGKHGGELLDIPFAPEAQPAAAIWKPVSGSIPTEPFRWKLLDNGEMEVLRKGGSMVTKRRFQDFKLHVEFRTPFMPTARGQARGNSGVYLQGRYEVQVLDSYGLEGKDNECGGVYKISAPRVNMCAPPLQWQTYDVTFKAPRFDKAGKRTADALLTVLHNGVEIHKDLKIPKPTGGGRSKLHTPGPILLQDHGNPVRYRNIWIQEL